MPPAPYNVLRIPPLNGGLNTYNHPTLINDNQVSVAVNLDFDTPGLVVQRPGYERQGNEISSVNAALGLGTFEMSNGSSWLITKVNGTYYSMAVGDTTWSTISGGYATTASVFGKDRNTIYNDVIYFHNPTDPLISWNGTGGFTSYLSAPKGSMGVIYGDRMWVAGVSTNLSRLYYSVVGTVTDFAGAGSGFIDININDGSVITGIGIAEGTLIVHKGNGGVYEISFSSSNVPSAVRAAGYKGAIRHQALAQFQTSSVYLAADKAVRTLGQLPYYPDSVHDPEASLPVRDTLQSIKSSATTLAAGIFFNNKYFLSIPYSSSTYNDLVITFAYGAFSIYTNVYAADFASWQGYLYFADSRKGQIYRFSTLVNADDGTAIESMLQTKMYAFSHEYATKQILGINQRLFIDEGSSVSVSYASNLGNFGSGLTIAPSSTTALGAAAPTIGSYLTGLGLSTNPVGGTGLSTRESQFVSSRWSFVENPTYIQVQFRHNTINKTWALINFDLVGSESPYQDWADINATLTYS